MMSLLVWLDKVAIISFGFIGGAELGDGILVEIECIANLK